MDQLELSRVSDSLRYVMIVRTRILCASALTRPRPKPKTIPANLLKSPLVECGNPKRLVESPESCLHLQRLAYGRRMFS